MHAAGLAADRKLKHLRSHQPTDNLNPTGIENHIYQQARHQQPRPFGCLCHPHAKHDSQHNKAYDSARHHDQREPSATDAVHNLTPDRRHAYKNNRDPEACQKSRRLAESRAGQNGRRVIDHRFQSAELRESRNTKGGNSSGTKPRPPPQTPPPPPPPAPPPPPPPPTPPQ